MIQRSLRPTGWITGEGREGKGRKERGGQVTRREGEKRGEGRKRRCKSQAAIGLCVLGYRHIHVWTTTANRVAHTLLGTIYGHFAPLSVRPRTFRPQDVSPPGRFATMQWTIRPLEW